MTAGGCSMIHASVTVSTPARAHQVFGELFGMGLVKEMTAPRELVQALFARDEEVRILVFDGNAAAVEVFVSDACAGRADRFDHICLTVPDRPSLLLVAGSMGFEVRRFPKGDRDVVFLQDLDGNLYEIKQADPVS